MRVLLVEPDKKLAGTYCAALEAQGYAVGWAAHAQDAVLVADEGRPDLVLLELQLASHNGIEFLYEFRSYADWREVPIVLLTSVGPHALSITPEMMQQFGIERTLYKPATTLKHLLRTVREVAHV